MTPDNSSNPAAHPSPNPWLIAIAVMSGTFMEVLDTTVVNVSLPHIAGNLSATTDEATWTLTSYLVANAIVLPMTGWLASTFGRKRLLTASVVGFTAASFLCGLAPTLGFLIFSRGAGRVRRRVAATFTSHLAGSFSPGKTRPGHGFLGLGHRRRPHARSRAGRMAHG